MRPSFSGSGVAGMGWVCAGVRVPGWTEGLGHQESMAGMFLCGRITWMAGTLRAAAGALTPSSVRAVHAALIAHPMAGGAVLLVVVVVVVARLPSKLTRGS